MTGNVPTLEVLCEGEVQLLSASGHTTHGERELREAWTVLAEHMHLGDHTTAEGRDATHRILIVPQHEMEKHVLLIMDGRTWKLTQERPNHASVSIDSWRRILSALQNLPTKLSERASELSEERIRSLVDVMIDVDPFRSVEARIDVCNAELRMEFLNDYPVLDSATVHRRAGLKGRNTAQTVNAWRKRGRILGLQIQSRYGYPEFQFDADGQPLKLMKAVLDALPTHLTAWQRAFWFVSPKEGLDGRTPAMAIQAEDDCVVYIAESAGRLPVG